MKKGLRTTLLAVPAALMTTSAVFAHQDDSKAVKQGFIERGRYVVATAGCNDCHTPGYAESGGTMPTSDWLMGNGVGFAGPWGVTYPANLRLEIGKLSEAQWLAEARLPRRPPMPWFALRDMSDHDLRAIYWFIRSLGPAGVEAPEYRTPGEPVTTPVINFVPQFP